MLKELNLTDRRVICRGIRPTVHVVATQAALVTIIQNLEIPGFREIGISHDHKINHGKLYLYTLLSIYYCLYLILYT